MYEKIVNFFESKLCIENIYFRKIINYGYLVLLQ